MVRYLLYDIYDIVEEVMTTKKNVVGNKPGLNQKWSSLLFF